MKKRHSLTQQQAESLAIQALSFIAGEPERLGRFLALSGIDAGAIRSAAAEPGFLLGVLDYIAGDEALLLAFAGQCGIEPATVDAAHRALAGPGWERDLP
jgi:hypothetical protein